MEDHLKAVVTNLWQNSGDFLLSPANKSSLNQHRNNVDCQCSSTLLQRWYLVKNEKWADKLIDFVSMWQKTVDWTSMNQRCFNVDTWLKMKVELTYIYGYCLNIDKITPIQCRWSYVVSTLIFGWKQKLNQHIFIDIPSTLRKQHWNNFVSNCCTDVDNTVAQ